MSVLTTVSIARCSAEIMKSTATPKFTSLASYNAPHFTTTRTQAISDPVITSKGLIKLYNFNPVAAVSGGINGVTNSVRETRALPLDIEG